MDDSLADPGPGAADDAQNDPASIQPTDQSASVTRSRGPLALLRERWKGWLLVLIVVTVATTLIVRRVVLSLNSATAVVAQPQPGGKKPGAPTDPFSFGAFSVRPSETDRVESGIKPGHWTDVALEVRANFDDFRGDLAAAVVNAGGDGVDLDKVPYRLQSSRPAVLPKSQKKILDIGIYNPVENFSRQVSSRLLSSSGREVWNARELLVPLPADQYFLVVLARQPDDYRYLHTLDSVWWPQGTMDDRGPQAHYRLLLPGVTAAAPLPTHALYWTSTAALLWDGVDPDLLTPAQQQALVDWLHWGGQLIVSGPDSLEAARATFLDGFLPAAPGASWELSAEALAPLSKMSPDATRPLRVREPWTGQHLNVDGRDANVLAETPDHEPLVAERRVGRGRTVVTAFRLTQRALIDWPGYDAVFNAALLRRPARRFVKSVEDLVGVTWADGVEHDPARVSQLRYFTRDAGRTAVQPPAPDQMPWRYGLVRAPIVTSDDPFDPETGEFASRHRIGPGVAGWDDFSRSSDSAREILKKAAGIQVPRGTFVASLLVAYILVLVPLNWLLFRLMGRVEAAWVAAPIVAVAFGALVARLAQLDIGFARSATEISVLEVQGDYPRAHLTRYWALYTSLSSQYTLAMANPTAVAVPFATGTSVQARQSRGTVILRQVPETGTSAEAPVHLAQLDVASNSTGMVHSEEMFDLGGSFQLSPEPNRGWRLRNGTGLRLSAVTIASEKRQVALGKLAPGDETVFRFDEDQRATGTSADWSSSSSDEAEGDHPALDPRLLGEFALSDTPAGELRLVAWTEDELAGVTLDPAANQTRRATVVVAHLRYAPPSPLEMDFSSRAQVAQSLPEDSEDSNPAPSPGQ